MARYFPIRISEENVAVQSSLASLHWQSEAVVADFIVPQDENKLLRVKFDKTHVIRVLDEMPLSTESEPGRNEGLVSNHFAYRVEDSLFWNTQSEALKAVFPSARHYRFITGWACLDVIASIEPQISFIQRISQTRA